MFAPNFRRIASTIALTSTLALGSWAAQAASYTIDPSHSSIEFRTQHFGYSWLSGRFNKFSGKLSYDPTKDAGAQSVSVNIDTTSIDTNWPDRDKHLRSKDFFKTDSITTATFESTSYAGDASGGVLKGKLTLLGVSKDIEFAIKKIGEGKDPWGGYRVGFEGAYVLTRKDFGMDFNLGPAAEKVEITLLIEAIKDK